MNYDSHEIAARTRQAEEIVDAFASLWQACAFVANAFTRLAKAAVSGLAQRLRHP